MSKASARSIPSVRAVCAAAATPAAGPDMAIVSGRALAASTDIMPPPECKRCRARPAGSRERHDRRIEHRGARALVLAELRVDLARDREVAEVRCEQLAERLLVRGIG